MPKIKKIINGEYIEGTSYSLEQRPNGKVKLTFNPDEVITPGTAIGAEEINEIQKNGVYSCTLTRTVVGQKEIYTADLTGFEEFGKFELILQCNFLDTNTTQTPFLRIENTEYQIQNATPGKLRGEVLIKIRDNKAYPLNLLSEEAENNNKIGLSLLGALNLKNWLVSNYTSLMNNIKEALDTKIGTKLNHGGYAGTGQTLFNLIESTKTSLTSLINGKLSHGGYSGTGQDLKNLADSKVNTGDLGVVDIGDIKKNGFYRVRGTIHEIAEVESVYHVINYTNPQYSTYGFQIISEPEQGGFYYRWKKAQDYTKLQEIAFTGNYPGTLNDLDYWIKEHSIWGQHKFGVTDLGNESKPLQQELRSGFYRASATRLTDSGSTKGFSILKMGHPSEVSYATYLLGAYSYEDEFYLSSSPVPRLESSWRIATREYMNKKLINHSSTISQQGTYNLATALSSAYKFINIRFSEPNGNDYNRIVKIPYDKKDIYYTVFGVFGDAQRNNETGKIKFLSDTQFSYNIQFLDGTNQCCIKEIWQSNI